MKLHTLTLLSVFAIVFVSCAKTELKDDSLDTPKITINVIAGADETKTALDGSTIKWVAGAENIRLLESSSITSLKDYVSSTGVTSDGGVTMSFPVSVSSIAGASRFKYYSVYPSSAFNYFSGTEGAVATTPANQNPTATSFDGTADILLSKPVQTETQPSSVTLQYTRANAIGKMQIVNLQTSEPLVSVEVSANVGGTDVILAGGTTYNLNESAPQGDYGDVASSKVIKLSYTGQEITADSQSGMKAYFLCYPFSMSAGGTFKVVVTTENYRIVKSISTSSLEFKAGEGSVFKVDMSDCPVIPLPKAANFGIGYGGGNQGTGTLIRVPIRHNYSEGYDWSNMPAVTMECLVKFQSGIPYEDTSSGNTLNTLMGMPNYFRLRLRDFYSEGAVSEPGTIRIQGLFPGGEITSQTNIVYDKWYHVAMVFDNGKAGLYIDGQLHEEALCSTSTLNLLTSPGYEQDIYNDFFIGSCGEWPKSRFVNGWMSECRLWSVARTADQISDNRTYVDPQSSGLLGYWKMAGTSDSEAMRDVSGHCFDATNLDNTVPFTEVNVPVEYELKYDEKIIPTPPPTPVANPRCCITDPVAWPYNQDRYSNKQRFDMYKSIGVDELRAEFYWSYIEDKEGVWNEEHNFFNYLQLAKDNGFKIKLILGVISDTPTWFYTKQGDCSTLKRDSSGGLDKRNVTVFLSYWYPDFEDVVEEVTTKMVDILKKKDLWDCISCVVPSLGSSGEPIFPPYGIANANSGSTLTDDAYWFYSDVAIEDFRAKMEKKYTTVSAANTAWGSSYSSWSAVTVLEPGSSHGATYWQDVLEWARDTKREKITAVLDITRSIIPDKKMLIYAPARQYTADEWVSTFSNPTKAGNHYVKINTDLDYLYDYAIAHDQYIQYTNLSDQSDCDSELGRMITYFNDRSATNQRSHIFGETPGDETVATNFSGIQSKITTYSVYALDYTHSWFLFRDQTAEGGKIPYTERMVSLKGIYDTLK